MKVKDILPLCPKFESGNPNITVRKETPNAYNPKWMNYPEVMPDFDTRKYPLWVYEAEIKEIRAGWPLANGNYDECLNIII